ncbi:protein FAM117B isoform X2 [Anoplophora glabripennis]|uniref:protein FAM117B isoform X2 n=1 Tax=Anoplophora glabripennis TaxID=217634 RepID=UPI00087372C9|nr:protein FAM117B isoform X2 [Anoplophora glabripennis]
MSGQHSQGTPARIPKSSPSSGKQGPMKATIPMSSVLKQSSTLISGNSPAVSPTYYWKNRTSPDHSSGQRSPGSSAYKGKSKTMRPCSSDGTIIRRTASLDTIYLKGQWPRDSFYWHTGILQIDKATQTDESDWLDPRKIHSISETEDKIEKLTIRQKPRGTKETNGKHLSSGDNTLNSSSQTLSSCILSPTFKATTVCIPIKPIPKASIRSSVEGLNQEIERIVQKTGGESHSSRSDDYEKFYQITPEGHRAPLPDLFRSTRSRSVNTQTPQDFGGSGHSSGDSVGSSPDQETNKLGTSPHINKFLAREPPDGCEKVHLKSLDETKYVPLEHAPQPCTFKLKPSLGSAFHILHPNISNTVDQDLPLVPPQHELN